MKVLVTGATGFVGGRLTQELVRRGYELRVLRRATSKTLMVDDLPLEHIIGDILDAEAVARAIKGCDWVFHTAALSSYWRAARQQVYRMNVEGTRVVMEACLAAGVRRVVHTSSVAAVGIPKDGLIAGENSPFDRLSATFAYADSKRQAEAEVLKAVAQGLNAVIVNPAAVIGAGDHNLISGSIIIEYTRRDLPFVTPGGLCMADIDAVTAGHILAAEHGRAGERYILGGENLSHLEIARIITDVAGKPAPRWVIPAPLLGPAAWAVDIFNRVYARPPVVSGDQLRNSAFGCYYSSDKAQREFAYPMLPFRDAVEKAYRWYKDHGYLN